MIYEMIFARFSQEFIFLLNLKELKYLKHSTRPEAKILFHFYLLILWLLYVLLVNTYPLFFETASLANILFFAALTNNDINKVAALEIKTISHKRNIIS